MATESIKPKRWATLVIVLAILAFPVGFIIGTVFHNPGLGIGLMFLVGGSSFLSLTLFGSLRRGVISVGRFGHGSVYYRDKNPFGFWFYISFFTLIFVGVTLVGLLFITHPSLLNNDMKQHRPNTALEPTPTAL